MSIVKTRKQVREGQHIYGQLPNHTTPEQLRTIALVLLAVAVFAAVVILGPTL